MNKRILGFCLSLIGSTTFAQSQDYTMQQAVLGLRGELAPQNLKQLQWIPNTTSFSQVVSIEKKDYLLATQVPHMTVDTLLSITELNQQLFKKDSLKTLPSIHWINKDRFYFQIDHQFFAADKSNTGYWQLRPWAKLPADAENIKVDNNSLAIVYTVGNNLFYLDGYQQKHSITNDAGKDIINGQSVHRNEFGIDGGIFISPKGNYVAFYRMDQSMVNDYPVIDWKPTPAKNENIKYPMSGQRSHEVTLGVYNPISKSKVFLKTGSPGDQYLTAVTWSPDEQHIFVALLNRAQNHMWLNKYNARTGELVKTLFEEKDNKYVEPQHPLAFLPGKDNEFLWWSQRDGFMHLYRYNTDGKLLNRVTSGDWLVNSIDGFRPDAREVIISATKESAMEKHGYAVNWMTGATRRIDNSAGIHTIKPDSKGNYVIDHYQSKDVPRKIELLATHGKWSRNILNAANTLQAFERPKVEWLSLKADDGTSLNGKLIYPKNFDPSKKYPVIVYLYNGPHVQLITNGFPETGNLWYDYMTQHGYFVFTMDGRGSGNRGLKFEQATFRQLGTVEMNDQLKGVEYLKSLPFIDADRMGVHGWSFGGFMTTSLMLRHPGIFKCAVAGGPVIDWSMYEVMYTERYMDTPQENPKGYEDNNLLTKTKNLKGKLLMIHGAQDDVVVWQHSIDFVKACVDNGVQIDYFVYPGHPHNVQGKDRVHLMQKITDYFDTFLK